MSGQGLTRSYIYQQVAPLAKAETYLNLLRLRLSSCWLWYKFVTPPHKSQGPRICVSTMSERSTDGPANKKTPGRSDGVGRISHAEYR